MSENVIPESVLAKLPETVREEVAQLPGENQGLFIKAYRKKKKSVLIAYLLCVAYGSHNVYLEKIDLAFWFWFTLGGMVIWWIIEFFRVPRMVRAYNRSVARIVLAEARADKDRPRL